MNAAGDARSGQLDLPCHGMSTDTEMDTENEGVTVRVKIIPSSVETPERGQFSSTYIVNDSISVDAGSLGIMSVDAQRQVRHVLLSHGHIDHVATLPIYLDNVYRQGSSCPIVYAHRQTLGTLRAHVFNEQLWPDFERLSTPEDPFVVFRELTAGTSLEVGDLRVTPLELDHVVPTFGFLLTGPQGSIAFISDTCRVDQTIEFLAQQPRLRAVFLECSFPNRLAELAAVAKHLTPLEFGRCAELLPPDVSLIAVHLKSAFFDELVTELSALGRNNIRIGQGGRSYEFSDQA